jgi:hypothetical protein
VSIRHKLVQRPHLELAHVLEAEPLVEADRRLVLDEHLQPQLVEPACARLLDHAAHEHGADPRPAVRDADAEPADPAPAVADRDRADPGRLAVDEGDAREAEIVVPGLRHESERGLVDAHRHEVVLVACGEDLRQLRMRPVRRRCELHAARPR